MGYVITVRSDGFYPEYDSVYSTIKEVRAAYQQECIKHRGKSEVSMIRRRDGSLLHRQNADSAVPREAPKRYAAEYNGRQVLVTIPED